MICWIVDIPTAWRISRFWVYFVNLRIYFDCGKRRTEKTPNLVDFHRVIRIYRVPARYQNFISQLWRIFYSFVLCAVFKRDHSFSTYTKFSKKRTFVTPWHAHRHFFWKFVWLLNRWYQIDYCFTLSGIWQCKIKFEQRIKKKKKKSITTTTAKWLLHAICRKNAIERRKNSFYRHNYPSWVIENIFRIMLTMWRIFYTPINASAENIKKTT